MRPVLERWRWDIFTQTNSESNIPKWILQQGAPRGYFQTDKNYITLSCHEVIIH